MGALRSVAVALAKRKGNINLVIGLVVAIVTIAILIPIGMMISASVFTSINTTALPPQAQQAFQQTQTNVWGSYNLLGLLPLVLIAGGVIAAITAVFLARREG